MFINAVELKIQRSRIARSRIAFHGWPSFSYRKTCSLDLQLKTSKEMQGRKGREINSWRRLKVFCIHSFCVCLCAYIHTYIYTCMCIYIMYVCRLIHQHATVHVQRSEDIFKSRCFLSLLRRLQALDTSSGLKSSIFTTEPSLNSLLRQTIPIPALIMNKAYLWICMYIYIHKHSHDKLKNIMASTILT